MEQFEWVRSVGRFAGIASEVPGLRSRISDDVDRSRFSHASGGPPPIHAGRRFRDLFIRSFGASGLAWTTTLVVR